MKEKCAFPNCRRRKDLRKLATKTGVFLLCPEHYELAAQKHLTQKYGRCEVNVLSTD